MARTQIWVRAILMGLNSEPIDAPDKLRCDDVKSVVTNLTWSRESDEML
jgi:hypothetical protein